MKNEVNSSQMNNDEARLFYEISRDLASASTPDELLTVVVSYVRKPELYVATLSHLEVDDNNKPRWMEVLASWERSGGSNAVGYRVRLDDFSFARLWIEQPEKPLFVGNTATDPRIDTHTRKITTQHKVGSIVSMPLYLAGQWIGLLTLNWSKPQEFDNVEKYFYGAIGMQLAAILRNWRWVDQVKTEVSALPQGDEKFQIMVEKSSDLFGLISGDGYVRYVSPSIKTIMGYSPEDVIGRTAFEFIHPDEYPSLQEKLKQFSHDNRHTLEMEFRFLTADGQWKYLELRCQSFLHLPEVNGIICNARDITERKVSEEMNSELNRRLLTLQTASAMLTASLDSEQILVMLAREMINLLGMTGCAIHEWLVEEEVIVLRAFYSLNKNAVIDPVGTTYKLVNFPTTEKVLLEGHIEQLRINQDDIHPSEFNYMQVSNLQTQIMVPMKLKENSIGLIEVWDLRAERVYSDELLELAQLLANHATIAIENARLFEQAQQEIADRQRTEDALLQSEARNKALLNAIPDIMVRRKRDGTYLDVRANPANLLLPAEAMIGKKVTEVVPASAPQAELVMQATERALETGEMQVVEYQLVMNGATKEFEARTVPSGQDEVISIIRDITKEKQLEAQLRQAHKMEAIGQLAAGIAHDFNNILTTILGYAELLTIDPSLSEAAKQDLERILRQGQRAAHLVKQILDFARQSKVQKQYMDLKAQMQETITQLLDRTLPENISVDFTVNPGQYWITADPAQLQQVFINLALNARDAMPQGGNLYFRLSLQTFMQEDALPLPEMTLGEWIQITITDTGTGIYPNIVPYIFDPFFTTKEVGKGTGLGLAQVFGIIKNHKGHITVNSRVAEGTTFTIYIPAATVLEFETQPVELPEKMSTSQEKTILLVEDEAVVLETLEQMLIQLGYRVMTAANGREGVDLYKNHQNVIDLILTDATMPEMGGFDLMQQVRQIRADAKVVIISGYPSDIDKDFQTEVASMWLQKPISLKKLRETLEQVL
ncbi:MAG: PAS domain S-box protein [Anaerolineae bacterium]|nr:PAS domain S-box protein [Anaerolineae bacterium]